MSELLPHSAGEETEFCVWEQLGSGLTGPEWATGPRPPAPGGFVGRFVLYQNLNFTGDFDSPHCQLSASLSLGGRVWVGGPGHLW